VRLADAGPEYRGGLSNHGPMVAEALAALGRDRAIAGWVEAYRKRLEPAPPRQTRIDPQHWRECLGDRNRHADWAEFFAEELREAAWREVLGIWVPRLAPGLIGAAAHGLLRTGHAARALQALETPPRFAELAQGLAYWAAVYQEVPAPVASRDPLRVPSRALPPADAVLQIPVLPPDARSQAGRIAPRLAPLAGFAPFAVVPGLIDPSSDPMGFHARMTGAFAQVFLQSPRRQRIVFVHALTGPVALRSLLPALNPPARVVAMRHAWHAAAALQAAFGAPLRMTAPPLPPHPDPAELADLAIENGDAHAIKFIEACLREWDPSRNPAFLHAAARMLRG